MATDQIAGMTVTNGEIRTPAVGASALLAAATDGVGIELDSTTGALRLVSAGASKANGVQRDEVSKFAGAFIRGALADGTGTGGVFSETNTYGTDLLVWVVLDVTTPSTIASTIDVGEGPGGVTHDNLMDGLDVGTAAGVFTSLAPADIGTNGKALRKWLNGERLDASQASGTVTGLVGTYAIFVLDIN